MQSLENDSDSSEPAPGISYRRLVYFVLFLAAVWLISLSSIILFLNKSPFGRPRHTGYQFIDDIIKYLSSISRSGFSPFEFLGIEFWSLYLTVFLASLGAVGGLFKLYQGIAAPSKKEFSAERRDNMLILACASVSAVILGSSAVLASIRKKYLLQKFYALEVHLVRFEGLMFNSLSISANPKLIDTFFEYMLGYYGRIEGLMLDISYVYDFTDEKKISEEMLKFAGDVKKLKMSGFADKTETTDTVRGEITAESTLLDLLESLEYLQEAVRRHIRGLER
jgi:hypothetical protein